MSQNGSGSWSKDTGFFNLSTLTASVAYTGALGNGTANLNISHGCPGETGGQGGGTMDCDQDFDNSPASDCQTTTTPPTGGQGGGQVLGAATTAGVAATPAGGVNAGTGGVSTLSLGALVGLTASIGSLGLGARRLSKTEL
jgi:hypothetical protein